MLGCCLSLTALGALAPWAAWGSPLPKSSPLYSPGPSIVDENPDVRAEYKGTITTTLNAPPVPESVEQHAKFPSCTPYAGAIAALIGSQGALCGLRRIGIAPSRLTHLTGIGLTGAASDVLAGL